MRAQVKGRFVFSQEKMKALYLSVSIYYFGFSSGQCSPEGG